jgi:hypothetical protein
LRRSWDALKLAELDVWEEEEVDGNGDEDEDEEEEEEEREEGEKGDVTDETTKEFKCIFATFITKRESASLATMKNTKRRNSLTSHFNVRNADEIRSTSLW